MTVRALRRLEALVDDGATVVGRRPTSSPSLADAAAEHARLCDRLWGGAVVDTDDLAAALDRLGLRPSVAVEGADVLRIGRRIGDTEVVFLANPLPEPATVTVDSDGLVAWDPVTLRRTPVRDGRIELPPLGSVFLVPGGPTDGERPAGEEIPLDGAWRLSLPAVLETELPEGPRPWTELGTEAAGFAGIGTYVTEVDLADAGPMVLRLGDVGDLARVRVNGTDCGVVWTEPWELDVTAALRPGRNTVEIDVANAWMNRLIAEAAEPTGEIFGPVASVYSPDAAMHPSGLRGPVVLHSGADGKRNPTPWQ
jgi:hypothetical protein